VFDCGGGKLFSQYVQLSQIPWSEWTDIGPYESSESFILASQDEGDFIIGSGDVNGSQRIANAVPASIRVAIPGASRSTADSGFNARGHALL
jgi:hypothetical protein